MKQYLVFVVETVVICMTDYFMCHVLVGAFVLYKKAINWTWS